MNHRRDLSLADQLAAAQDWWRDAGVDMVFVDEPQAWLAPAGDEGLAVSAPVPAQKAQMAEPPPPPFGGEADSWPKDIALFVPWWAEQIPIAGSEARPTVLPRGPDLGAELLVLVPMPEEADREFLLSGPQGALLDGFYRAANLEHSSVRIASVLPRYLPMADWAALDARGVGALTLHHIALSRPKRVMVLGSKIPPLLGHDLASAPSKFTAIAAEGLDMPALAHHGPEQLLQNARLRAQLWQRWLSWTHG